MLFRHNKLLPGLLHVRTYASLPLLTISTPHYCGTRKWCTNSLIGYGTIFQHLHHTMSKAYSSGWFMHKEANRQNGSHSLLAFNTKCSECLQDSRRVLTEIKHWLRPRETLMVKSV